MIFHRLLTKQFYFVCLLSLLYLLSSQGWANPSSVEQLISLSDEKFKTDQLSACLELLQQAERLSLATEHPISDQAEILWRMSRVYTEQGNKIYTDKKKGHKKRARKLFVKAEQLARRSTKLSPKNSQCYLCVSNAAGSLTQVVGVREKIKLSEAVREFADRAVELDPSNHYAHYILARWHHGMANVSGVLLAMVKLIYGGLPPASMEKSVHHFQQAIQHDSNNVRYRLEFSRIALSLQDWTLAQLQLDVIQTLIEQSEISPNLEDEVKKIQNKLNNR